MTQVTKKISMLLALGLVFAACSANSTGGRKGNTPTVSNQGSCPTEHLTATCTCASQNNLPGRQTCISGMWTACECEAAPTSTGGMGGGGTGVVATDGGTPSAITNDPAGNSSATRFAWKRTPFDLGSCKAGHYVGKFDGFYGSPVIFGAPFPVVATDGADGSPGLEFTLNKTPGSGEIFAINGGKMRGTASGIAAFTADLNGTLDCATKKYVGTIENGTYTVGTMDYHFVGTMTADYDKLQNAFINGVWHCTEPPSMTIPPGGDGHWDTQWQAM
jgi:hypothetical protein